MSIKQKITAGMTTAAMLAGVLAPVSHASTVTIKGNGAGSKNVVAGISVKATRVRQSNFTVAKTAVISSANTGDNQTNANTGAGGTTSDTGNATSTVGVIVTGGDNTASLPDCGCPTGDHSVIVQGNGAGSTNVIFGADIDVTKVSQSSATVAKTFVVSSANTGGNETNDNTGAGGTSSDTGNASSTVGVTVSGGDNTLN